MDELLLIDKPAGITSFGVIAQLRRILRIQKIGHAGTLDPMATGLLIVGVGPGTKRLAEYLKLPKVYDATIRLGTRTSTSDIEGAVLEEIDVPVVDTHEVQEVIEGLRGTLALPVSAYSAIKQGGEPLYKKVRRGESVVAPIRTMEVTSAVYVGHICRDGRCDIRAQFSVSSGTYIRSLAEEVGKRLNVPATLAALRRTEIGPFSVRDALPIEMLKKQNGGR